jgi:hypothetical protein
MAVGREQGSAGACNRIPPYSGIRPVRHAAQIEAFLPTTTMGIGDIVEEKWARGEKRARDEMRAEEEKRADVAGMQDANICMNAALLF